MKPDILYRNDNLNPTVSIILVDWSCRESFHALEYLNNLSIPRDQYEIIWIEYYHRAPAPIREGLDKSAAEDKPSYLDQWIVMNMPENIYYHKHLMYNIGIIASRGRIICICDSDAVFAPTFVVNILQAFTDREIVLHIDELRNLDHRFYPFNYPTINEILGDGCVKGSGHHINYGACMCALREDLIAIGGADEHIDYLGHICGPYEMTFRLRNNGKKEIWHQNEFIYHVWHPGTDGAGNRFGPHVGHMSTTADQASKTGRIFPLVENPSIRDLRLGKKSNASAEELLSYAIRDEFYKDWIIN